MNLKLRRYVQKSTLKRKYMTKHMSDYVFDGFLKALNKGLIFKDSNIYTQFSLKAELVNNFYEAYFSKSIAISSFPIYPSMGLRPLRVG